MALWNGEAPKIDDLLISPLIQIDPPTPQFIQRFNIYPQETINEMALENKRFHEIQFCSQYLFLGEEIHPQALTYFFLSNQGTAYPKLYEYFSCLCTDYMTIADAARYLLPRIAFPKELPQIEFILSAFSAAYIDNNPFYTISIKDVTCLTLVLVIQSLHGASLSLDFFFKLVENIPIVDDIKKANLYSVARDPIPLYFSFLPTVKPLTSLSAQFKTPKSFSQKATYVIQNGALFREVLSQKQTKKAPKTTTDDDLQKVIDLNGVEASVTMVAKQKKALSIKRFLGGPLIEGKLNDLVLIPEDETDLDQWANTIKFLSYCGDLLGLAHQFASSYKR